MFGEGNAIFSIYIHVLYGFMVWCDLFLDSIQDQAEISHCSCDCPNLFDASKATEHNLVAGTEEMWFIFWVNLTAAYKTRISIFHKNNALCVLGNNSTFCAFLTDHM